MVKLNQIHHVAIICSNYQRSKRFYCEVLGLKIEAEHFRTERRSYKLDLRVNDRYTIELFSFDSPPVRVSGPEACGLRHLAFEVDDIEMEMATLQQMGVEAEAIRVDEYTGKRFTFFNDPDGLPLELYEK